MAFNGERGPRQISRASDESSASASLRGRCLRRPASGDLQPARYSPAMASPISVR